MKVLATIRSGFLTTAAVLGVSCILVFAISMVFGLRPIIVTSGSMEPTIPTGSLIFSRQASAATVARGDIVSVERPDGRGLVTHRVVDVERQDKGWRLIMRGDANAVDDPRPYDVTTVGQYVFSVPHLGTVAAAFQTRLGIMAMALVSLSLVAAFLWNPDDHVRAGGEPPSSAGSRNREPRGVASGERFVEKGG